MSLGVLINPPFKVGGASNVIVAGEHFKDIYEVLHGRV